MTREEKQLLLKDLCARLPYRVIVQYKGHNTIIKNKLLTGSDLDCNMEYYKPYLRLMSSMTEEEGKELSKILNYEFYIDDDFALMAEDNRHRIRLELCEGYIDWLNANHFNYRLPPHLFIEAPEGMYKTE